MSRSLARRHVAVAQPVEGPPETRGAAGSIPAGHASFRLRSSSRQSARFLPGTVQVRRLPGPLAEGRLLPPRSGVVELGRRAVVTRESAGSSPAAGAFVRPAGRGGVGTPPASGAGDRRFDPCRPDLNGGTRGSPVDPSLPRGRSSVAESARLSGERPPVRARPSPLRGGRGVDGSIRGRDPRGAGSSPAGHPSRGRRASVSSAACKAVASCCGGSTPSVRIRGDEALVQPGVSSRAGAVRFSDGARQGGSRFEPANPVCTP